MHIIVVSKFNCLYFLLLIYKSLTKHVDNEKVEFCTKLNCENYLNQTVCGMREEQGGFRLKIFQNECELLHFGCQVENKYAYGTINLRYCEQTFPNYFNNALHNVETTKLITENRKPCLEYCAHDGYEGEVCGIRKHGPGFKIRRFPNNCALLNYNCNNNSHFNATDLFICKDIDRTEDIRYINAKIANEIDEKDTENKITNNERDEDAKMVNQVNNIDQNMKEETNKLVDTFKEREFMETSHHNDFIPPDAKIQKNMVILDGSMLNFNGDINDTMENFFAATHVFDLPMQDLQKDGALNDSSRRLLLKLAGPVKVFQPWIVKPDNVSTDYQHMPTLSSCYHRCPTQCPDTYSPVCGVPGILAREPSLMFKNHCFMDVAQCKMRWENKSTTAISSSYVESSFMICLGDALNSVYRFLPLLRTLQHMGRLKKKGFFRYKMTNMGIFNNVLVREPKVMGK